ncbi:FHA domain-containing protein [Promicromonospora iranensis]|uniref:FHA domain-containing protein n=1 Tax=Promicromonospora iranensis TaxID=1105144 RepID=A0ABU2CKR4_9MICO|nr:FHA domain-containing protein [Promicromonospora iranensis]MDR7381925.1 hypothetical protein [Promicromonospora iranensis]
MTVVCPEGHPSQATDYCDVCGTPIPAGRPPAEPDAPAVDPAAGASAEASAEGSTAGPVTCPNCGDLSPSGSLFCENCGYDFTTGTAAPPAPPPSALDLSGLGTAPPANPPGPTAPSSTSPPPSTPAPSTSGVPAPSADGGGLSAPPVPGDDAWVAEIWVDPDWYAHERPEDPMPSAGLPGLVTLRQRSLLVGRPSQSRNIRPDVDCGSDPGVSRRHCQLTTDGLRWWVEDLGSSNGTFVAATGDPLPDTPLTQGIRREVEESDRIYIGAWTRLVIRKALPGEA